MKDELTDEYIQSADKIQQRIDELREKTKKCPWSELPMLYKRIYSLESMKRDCLYTVKQMQKYV